MNRLYYGDNLTVLRGYVGDESVDLIYLDPPFNSQATYNVLFRSTAGERSRAQIEAFDDTWHWGDEAELAFDGVMSGWVAKTIRSGKPNQLRASNGSAFQSESFQDELNLSKNIPFRQPPRLAFPDHVQNLVALNRSPRSIE